MTITPGQRAADDLAAVREHWGDLLAAIAEPPRTAEWMPYERRGFLDQLAAVDQADDEPTVGRLPLILREHPAPANLRALDAALDVEREVFEMCDAVAERVQLPARDPHGRWSLGSDPSDPRLWQLPTAGSALLPRPTRIITGTDPRAEDTEEIRTRRAGRLALLAEHTVEQPKAQRSATTASEVPYASTGSRRHGLHWAAVWLEGRALDDQADRALFAPTPAPLVDQIAEVARTARRRVEGALGRATRTTTLDELCPFCRAGRITVHNGGGDPRAAVATCSTGTSCPAPVETERGRRAWRGPALVGLLTALDARRTAPAA
ncbi:hypothetical protein J7F02_16460 [Streptomyces sp. ISL-112]|uniref:hypothetical protein n=1 Tax=unclassified Streptomyces TaxID=2593676 RepID=UPI001BEB7290|nr:MULTISPECIES: hypothetical protein [unclassified Streptomyces]MBT2427219.1 hypothetical protein [Streptomyces sp. ISL-112]MBT2465763.1 hypothetical protein [Streptomyces sp. ISL-63]